MTMRYNQVVQFKTVDAMNEWLEHEGGPINTDNPIQIHKVYRSADGMYFIWYTIEKGEETK